jgi:hypothetical protein
VPIFLSSEKYFPSIYSVADFAAAIGYNLFDPRALGIL